MNLNNISQIRYGGKDIVLGKLNGDILYKKESDEDIPVEPIYPYEVKFRSGVTEPTIYNYCTINGTKVKLSDMSYDSKTSIYTYNVGAPITSIRFNGYGYNIKRFGYNNILELIYLDISNLTNMSYMFSYCGELTSLDLSSFDTSNVTDMNYMFYECTSLTSLDVSNFDTSNVTSMNCMFDGCTSLTSVDLSNFDTSNVTNMSNMFYTCNKLTSLDLSSWDTSNVTNMRDMFNNCTGLISLNLEGWDLRKANTQTMLAGCNSLTDLNVKNWKCGDLLGCFINCSSLQKLDLSGWDTSETTSMQQLFYNCTSLININNINSLETSKVTNMYGLFAYTNLGQDAIGAFNSFNKSSVTNMGHMFEGCSFGMPAIIYVTDTTNVTNMSCMFADTSSSSYIQIELDTSSVTDMSYMFSGCGATVSCYFHFNGDCSHMFENFTGSLKALWGGMPTNASYMFASSNIDDGTFSSYIYYIDLQNCQNTSYMFYNCQNIYNLSFSDSTYHNMYNLYESAYMFADCFSLTLIEIPYMSTNYLWNYENMFYNVPDYCEIKIDRSLFYLDESSTGFSGYFQDY